MGLWRTRPLVAAAFKARPVETVVSTVVALAVIIGLVVFFGPDAKAVSDYDVYLGQVSGSTADDESAMDEQLVAKLCPTDDPCKPPPWEPDPLRRKYNRGELGNSHGMQVPGRIIKMMNDVRRRHLDKFGADGCGPGSMWFCSNSSSPPPMYPPANSCAFSYGGGCVHGDPAKALHLPWSSVTRVAWTCAGSGTVGAVWAMKGVEYVPGLGDLKYSYLVAAGAGFQDGVQVCAFMTAYHHFFDWPF